MLAPYSKINVLKIIGVVLIITNSTFIGKNWIGKNYLRRELIASCCMKCRLSRAYQRKKKQCKGCNGYNDKKPAYCLKCIIRNCYNIKNNKTGLCYECGNIICIHNSTCLFCKTINKINIILLAAKVQFSEYLSLCYHLKELILMIKKELNIIEKKNRKWEKV